MINKRSQVAIFIIIALLIVVVVVGYFAFRANLSSTSIPASIEPAYTNFLNCLEDRTVSGIDLMGFQAGYVNLPDFEPGSVYMPFSNQLEFLGSPVPYWYYVSGNNIQKEQVPTVGEMEDQLEGFIEAKISGCDFSSYHDQGFVVDADYENAKAKVVIAEDKIDIDLSMALGFDKGEDSVIVKTHKVSVSSKFGSLYESAKKIYDHEQQTLFLEEYAIDNLRTYAPVDGVELSCAPVVWKTDEIFDKLENGIEANTLALKVQGGNYELRNKEHEYFIIGVPVDADVQFLNSRQWPHTFEVDPAESGESVLIAKPIGNQPGLGVIGFCYVPYHYVYNVKYPVLVQLTDGDELFQFPMAVVIQGNNPRESLDVSASDFDNPEICRYKNTEMSVNVFDASLNQIDAEISYECFGARCDIGMATADEGLRADFPQCVNGFVRAKADGFKDVRFEVSTVKSSSVELIMDRVYETNVDLKLDGRTYNGNAIITFASGGDTKTVVYPEQKTVELGEGQYEISVNVYRNSSIKIPGVTTEHCVEVPRRGFGGVLGFTEENCFEVEIPEQLVTNALAGGGKENYFILESELENSDTIEVYASSLPVPSSFEELQTNLISFEVNDLDIFFR